MDDTRQEQLLGGILHELTSLGKFVEHWTRGRAYILTPEMQRTETRTLRRALIHATLALDDAEHSLQAVVRSLSLARAKGYEILGHSSRESLLLELEIGESVDEG